MKQVILAFRPAFLLGFFFFLAALPPSALSANQAPPSGTILPIRLNSTLSSAKSHPGQQITGSIMQDVPLASGVRIRKGSKVIGHIVEAVPATSGQPAHLSLQFDKIVSSGQTASILTNLRAIAGFMQINEAQLPNTAPGETDVYNWMTTTQVGGDSLYGKDGPVGAAENADKIIGKGVPDGVLARVRAKSGTKCEGPVDGNDSPQALWLFSTDACGVYGIEHVAVAHAGRTDPQGVIVLASDSGNFKIAAGAGLLLRIRAPKEN